jgi:hypothetical protein
MIGTKCPGQDMRYWTADDACEVNCPNCGEEIEFFKTDIRLRCPNCKTRVANPRFNLGCAEWCAYAEQCLGPGAKGLKSQSLKKNMEDYLKTKIVKDHDEVEKLNKLIARAENLCQDQKIDMLPVLASLISISLKRQNVIGDEQEFLDDLNSDNSWPPAAVKETQKIIKHVKNEEKRDKNDRLVAELLKVYQTDI